MLATDLDENYRKLRETYNTDKPLKKLYTRMNKCVYYATTASDLITENQAVCITYGLFAETGKF